MSETAAHLFEPPDPIIPEPDPLAGMSEGRKLTHRNNLKLANGVHPATGHPLILVGATCGTCDHCHRKGWHGGRSWIKCDRHRLGMSASAASDVRASWPACDLWVGAEEPT